MRASDPNSELYQIRPSYKEKFRSLAVKAVIREVLEARLKSLTYSAEGCQTTIREISDLVKKRMKDLEFSKRYKFVVQVTIGEQKGQGVRFGGRCFWDQETDACAFETYQNDNIFCSVIAFGIYQY